MKKNFKLIINTTLTILIFLFAFLFFIESNKSDINIVKTRTIDNSLNLEEDEMNLEQNKPSESFSIDKISYLDDVSYYSKLFTEILNKYNLNTIMITKNSNSTYIYETSILLESLNIPNGYKTTYINLDNDETMKTYISLVETLKNSLWNRTLNINISSNDSILTFNKSNYPEVYELLNAFNKDINIKTLESDINNLIQNKSSDILNELYSISKFNEDNSVFLQISIYLDNGIISDN